GQAHDRDQEYDVCALRGYREHRTQRLHQGQAPVPVIARSMCPSRTFAWLFVVACAGCTTPAPEKSVEPPNTVAAPKAAPAPMSAPAPRTAPAPASTPATAERELARGIHSYEEGEHKLASKQLQ